MINLHIKKINKIELLFSFIILIIFCSAISICSAAENSRWTFESINPWNCVQGVSFTISYFLHTGAFISYSVTLLLILFIWWRLYVLLFVTSNTIKNRLRLK